MNCIYCSKEAIYKKLGLCKSHYAVYMYRLKNKKTLNLNVKVWSQRNFKCIVCRKPRKIKNIMSFCSVTCLKKYKSKVNKKWRDNHRREAILASRISYLKYREQRLAYQREYDRKKKLLNI